MNNCSKVYDKKKLLVLGGAQVHVKLIEAAKKLGAYVIVTDNVGAEDSPGKQRADEYWDHNIYDIDEIVADAKKSGVEGVIAGWLDPCQRPYAEICAKLGLPCYAAPEQFFKMTDKTAFKAMCRSFGVDTIPEYTAEDIHARRVAFPVFVKPSDSRGSRGQSVCRDYEELEKAILLAEQESSNGKALVEKYITGGREFHVTYFFIDGEPHIVRTSDNYCGSEENNMQKVVSCAVMPSCYTDAYLQSAHLNVVKMFKSLGISYGPIFMQGFIDDGKFRFFDPGLRFPGVDFEMVFEKVHGISFMEAMVDIAFTGKANIQIPDGAVFLGGKRGSVLYLTICAGHITKINGIETVRNMQEVVSFWTRCKEGDTLKWSYNVNQRLAETDLLADDTDELIKAINKINTTVTCEDDDGNDMVFERFDTSRIVG